MIKTKRDRKHEYHKHHLDGNDINDKPENKLNVIGTIHQSMHRQAYNYLCDLNKVDDFLKWFTSKYNLTLTTNEDSSKTIKENKFKSVCVSGYFDPVHNGHVEMFNEAKALGNKLIVIINNDRQTIKKKGYIFQTHKVRERIIKAFACVDEVKISIDADSTVCETLKRLKPNIFANGGDRFADNIPEFKLCKELGIEMVFNVGKSGKINSSSELVEKARKNKEKNK